MALAIGIGLASVLTGLTTAYYGDLPPGGTIVLVAAAFFVLASGARVIHRRRLGSAVSIYTLDLHFLGLEKAIGAYLVETDDGPALHDCGPATTLPRLEECLRELDVELADVRHLLLSHIHFDHAGAAGSLVRRYPELTVWVSELGAPHLIDPSRLEASARRLYGDDFDRFWGELVPVPEANVRLADGRRRRLGGVPDAGPRVAPRLLPPRRRAARRRRLRDPSAAEALHPPAHAAARHRPRGLAPLDRRDRAPRARVPRADPLRHRERRARPPRAAARGARPLGRLGRDGIAQDDFVARAREPAATTPRCTTRPMCSAQSWLGLRRYWDKRAEADSRSRGCVGRSSRSPRRSSLAPAAGAVAAAADRGEADPVRRGAQGRHGGLHAPALRPRRLAAARAARDRPALHGLDVALVGVEHVRGERPDAELHELPGTCAHFAVDTDGTIYRLVPLGVVCRHTVGLNWTRDRDRARRHERRAVLANPASCARRSRLTLWLMDRFGIALRDVIGHNESLRAGTTASSTRLAVPDPRRLAAEMDVYRRSCTGGRAARGARHRALASRPRGARARALARREAPGDGVRR